MDIAQALEMLRPGAQWTLDGRILIWNDQAQSRPTDAEIAVQMAQPAPTPPNWANYLIAMMSDTLWQQWVDSLPAHHALTTTGAAHRENTAMLQIAFDNAVTAVAPPSGARAAWQAIADANNIAVDFEGS